MRGFKLSLADLCGKLAGNSTLPKMAGNAIDGLTDATAHPDDQVSRRQQTSMAAGSTSEKCHKRLMHRSNGDFHSIALALRRFW